MIDPSGACRWRGLYGLLVFAILLTLPLTGCDPDADFRPEARGEEGRITIVMDSTRWNGAMGEALREQITREIPTLPAPEPAFDIRQVNIGSQRQWDDVQTYNNLVIVAPLSDTTNEANLIRSVFSPEAQEAIQEGNAAIVGRDDVWRRRQQVFYMTAATPEALTQKIEQDGGMLVDSFNVVTRERLYREMFERGRQEDLEEQLMEAHDFAVNVQHDYQIALDTTNFVWLRRVLPETWRSLFVYYEENADPSTLTPEWVYATRDSLGQAYLQGSIEGYHVMIDYRRPLDTKEVNFEGRYALESRGLWIIAREAPNGDLIIDGGGPFLTYSFYDQSTGRLYMIDGMVFAPGHEKREFLR
ncbi:MAG: DUF4837 family protein, partial [Bacteroidetes bacterium]|nr:DUF4837 family protein [Bacteroidota bacterium]